MIRILGGMVEGAAIIANGCAGVDETMMICMYGEYVSDTWIHPPFYYHYALGYRQTQRQTL
jgi:hypothetical protein